MSIAVGLHVIRDLFRRVYPSAFSVTVFLDRGASPVCACGCCGCPKRVVSGIGDSLWSACAGAEAEVDAALRESPCLVAGRDYRVQVACRLFLSGKHFKVGDPRYFFSGHDAFSCIGDFCFVMEQVEYENRFADEDEADVSMSLFQRLAAKVFCDDFLFYDRDFGSLFDQALPVVRKHVQLVVRREIRDMLDLLFV